jgi:glycosyltransferase involved in cell wall biosynthesis
VNTGLAPTANQGNSILQEHTSHIDPQVSVVIPTYNHAGYVGEAIRSVLKQQYPAHEIIVVDDGSTDHTRQVIGEFGNQVHYIFQENRGLSAARNTGIRAATGDFIGVLDADDIYEPEFLRAMVERLQGQPDAAALYCGFQFVDANNHALPQVGQRVVVPSNLFQALLGGNFLVPECILVRRQCYLQVGPFDESLRACEDWDMWLRISRSYPVYGWNKILIRHRVVAGSMSSDPARMLQARLAVLQKLFEDRNGDSWSSGQAKQQAYGRAYLATALEYLQVQDPVKVETCLQSAIDYDPSLLFELDVYYELGCGDQPKGMRGDFRTLHIEENAQAVLGWLNRLFVDGQLPHQIYQHRKEAYANAYYALALLSYGADHYHQARNFLIRSAKYKPASFGNRSFSTLLLKTFLGNQVVTRLKHHPATSGF